MCPHLYTVSCRFHAVSSFCRVDTVGFVVARGVRRRSSARFAFLLRLLIFLHRTLAHALDNLLRTRFLLTHDPLSHRRAHAASMGQGQSQLKEELAAVSKRLEDATSENKKLQSANTELKSQVTSATEAVTQAQRDAAATEVSCKEQLAAKESEVLKAVKERELAVELRRSDSLLAKRIMTAQMRRAGEKEAQEFGGFEGSTMAAQLALAAQDEMQLRQVRPATGPFHSPRCPLPSRASAPCCHPHPRRSLRDDCHALAVPLRTRVLSPRSVFRVCQMLIHTATQLEESNAAAYALRATEKAQRRRELAEV